MSAFYTRPVTQMPGGIPFTDPRVPQKKFPGMEVSSEDEQIAKIIEWRRKNPNIYPATEAAAFDYEAVRVELRRYQKNRLGDNKQYFVDGAHNSIGIQIKHREPSTVCPKCGASEVTPRYCKTCRGSRVIGYTCVSCGKERGL